MSVRTESIINRDEMQNQLSELTHNLSKTFVNRAQTKEEALCREGVLKSLEKQLANSTATKPITDDDISQAEQNLNTLRQKNVETSEKLQQIKEELKMAFASMAGSKVVWADEQTENKIDRLQKEAKRLEERKQYFENGIQNRQTEIEQIEQEIAQLEEENKKLDEEEEELTERAKNATNELQNYVDKLSTPIFETELDEKQIELVQEATEHLKSLISGLTAIESIEESVKNDQKKAKELSLENEKISDINDEKEVSLNIQTLKLTGISQSKPLTKLHTSPTKTVKEISAAKEYIGRIGERFDRRYNSVKMDQSELKFLREKYANEKAPTEAAYEKKLNELNQLREEVQKAGEAREKLTEVEAELHQALVDKRLTTQALSSSIDNVQNVIEIKSRAVNIENENKKLREEQHNAVEQLDKTEKEIEEKNQILQEEEEHIRAAQFQLAGKEAELEKVILQLQDVANEDDM